MFYYIARFVVGLYYKLFFKVIIKGEENIPNGPVVICANHKSVQDPMVLGVNLKRKIHFLAKKELFNKKFYSLILKGIAAIPVDREGTDMKAYKMAVDILKNNGMLGVFVQGKRSSSIVKEDGKTGAAFFALKGNATIIPVGVSGDYKWGNKIYINIGEPIIIDEFRNVKVKTETLELVTIKIMEKIMENATNI